MTGWLRNTFGADKANDAQRLATEQAAAGQTEALNYLKQREELPMGIRDDALRGLADFYQVPGQPKTQDQLIQEAMSSPLYAAIMGTQKAGEGAILRNQSATGGLRSGTTQGALTDFGQQTANRALLESFGQAQERDDYTRALNLTGLSGLAGLEGNDQAIAGLTANIGNTRAQGTIAGAQTQTSALNNAFNTVLGFGQMLAGAGAFSDIRLKDNIRYVGKHQGFDIYGWDWNATALNKFGLEGSAQGVIAHHVFEEYPEAIGEHEGYLTVRYDMLFPELADG